MGTPGHAIEPGLYEAIAYHAAARRTQPTLLIKGLLPQSEHDSILEPEVKVPGEPFGVLNVPFLEMLLAHDRIYVAGPGKNHGVLATIRSLINAATTRPEVAGKIHVLRDCITSIPHPETERDALAEEALAGFAERGLRIASASDPLD